MPSPVYPSTYVAVPPRTKIVNLRVWKRLLQIQRVLVRHGLDEFISATHLLRPLRFVFYLAPRVKRTAGTRGARLRGALEELGPIFMKLGQVLSTRRDLLPGDIIDELAKLQDRVPPFPSSEAVAIIETAYGKPLDTVFARFDREPLAAATIAQVHTAQLITGQEVVVKVVRPDVRERIGIDLEVMYLIAELATRYWPEAQKLHPREVVDEYRKTILDELDLMREAANATQLRRNFLGSPLLYVPEVYWDHCRKTVMVMERIHGVLISDMAALRERGVNIRRLAENGVEIFFTQAFRDNFFHADMHPGNIFVMIDDPENPRYAAVDFGIVGTLQPRDQYYLMENFRAFFAHNYRRIAELHLESGWVPPHVRVDELESAVRTVCEPVFDKPIKDISFGQVLASLLEAGQRFDAELQPQLVLIQKTLLQIEGLGRQLYPELDLWETAQPLLRDWQREQMSVRSELRHLRRELPDLIVTMRKLPRLLHHAVRRAEEGDAERERLRQHAELLAQLRAGDQRRDTTFIAGVLLLAGILWFTFGQATAMPWVGWILLGLAAAVIARR